MEINGVANVRRGTVKIKVRGKDIYKINISK